VGSRHPDGQSHKVAVLEQQARPRPRASRGLLSARAAGLLHSRWWGVLIPLALAGVWSFSLTGLRLQSMSDLGLISVMPALSLASLGLLAVSFALTITRRPFNAPAAAAHVLVLVFALYGITELVEPIPRFATVYKHVGIIHYLQTHNRIDPNIDAYFDWPGFFALGDLLVKLAGWRSALAFAAWGPLLYNLLYLPPLLSIFSWATEERRARWLALWIFYSANWVGQDYISPQGTAYLLWLSMLALLLRFFAPSPLALPGAAGVRAALRRFGRRSLRALAEQAPRPPVAQSAAVLLSVLVMFAAVVSGHQLTPVPVILDVLGLTMLAGMRTKGLPLLLIVGWTVSLVFGATPFLSGHLSTLVGPLGSPGKNLTTGVSSRLAGSAEHRLIVKLSILFSLGVWLLAVLGAWRRLRAGRIDLAVLVIGASPLLLPLLQAYGGEIFLRVFLFSLPAVALLAAWLFFPRERQDPLGPARGLGRLLGRLPLARSGVWETLTLALVACLLLAGFQFARYGNERFANFTRADAAAVAALYRLAPLGATLDAGNDNLPWRYERYASYNYLDGIDSLPEWQVPHPSVRRLRGQLEAALGPRGGYVIFTPSTYIYAEQFEGTPQLLHQLAALLESSPGVRLLYQHAGASIFFVRQPPASAPPRKARAVRQGGRPR